MRKKLATFMLLSVILGCTHPLSKRGVASNSEDPFLWLEEVEGQRALDWVRQKNDATFADLEKDPNFIPLKESFQKILTAEDRIPSVAFGRGELFNFWQDATHVRGVWRKTSFAEYKKGVAARWTVLLDLDALAKTEKENWVWKGAVCNRPAYDRCLVKLSRGGKDAVVVREFSVENRQFVTSAMNGFELPESKQRIAWVDNDHLLVGTNFGEGSLTKSGYPRTIKYWERKQNISEAIEVLSANVSDVSVTASILQSKAVSISLISISKSFFEMEHYVFDSKTLKTRFLEIPKKVDQIELFGRHLVFELREDWSIAGKNFKTGSVVGLDFMKWRDTSALDVELIFEPNSKQALRDLAVSSDALYLSVLDSVQGRLLKVRIDSEGKWQSSFVAFPKFGRVNVMASSPFESKIFADFENVRTPTSVYLLDSRGRLEKILSLSSKFNAQNLEVEQLYATSADGTKVPYFIVYKKGLRKNAMNSTLQYAYGGFQIALTLDYNPTLGKAWIERGGVFVLASIRGGGEFGPRWHQAARKENRQRAFDDFIAVSEDLIARKYTSPKHLGAMGGSNGGLLMGAILTQRPDLYGAVVCQVPLLDMMRYNRLLAGASWQDEYGNPDESSAMRAALEKYSPYQNMFADRKYPKPFFLTSTKDDRVHPGHARKMVAKMESFGHPVYYFENIEGGHGAAANLEQQARRKALEYTYLWRQLKR